MSGRCAKCCSINTCIVLLFKQLDRRQRKRGCIIRSERRRVLSVCHAWTSQTSVVGRPNDFGYMCNMLQRSYDNLQAPQFVYGCVGGFVSGSAVVVEEASAPGSGSGCGSGSGSICVPCFGAFLLPTVAFFFSTGS